MQPLQITEPAKPVLLDVTGYTEWNLREALAEACRILGKREALAIVSTEAAEIDE